MERLTDRGEIIEELAEVVQYAAALALEARITEDDDPIQPYAKSIIREAWPLAVIGLFLMSAARLEPRHDARDKEAARALVARLRKLIRQQRQDRGDMMNYGTPDPEIVEAADLIEALSSLPTSNGGAGS